MVVEEAELESLEAALDLAPVGQARSRIVYHAQVLKVVYTVVSHPARANNSSVLVDVEQDMPLWEPPIPVRLSMEGMDRRAREGCLDCREVNPHGRRQPGE